MLTAPPQDTFQYTRPEIYDEFLDIMRACMIHRSNQATTIQWVNLLDVHYLDIIYGFKQFLPDKASRRLVDLRIVYLVLQDWLRRSRELEWSLPDWSRIGMRIREESDE
ncbi:uncharacterized protein EAE98_005613 [Botrytis deweyae]|uniref:Uncharacterized protein n=1 Tax=Botrytis deweyae TaxID=2478750 RepID=A0ABQ7IMI3_9HELO|nr:uncharacterized protein EAE98_005613 [Botrytis deweyae]KAF7928557.1 hypothetical protein EAE98_005613 [Botrytis deweyae]